MGLAITAGDTGIALPLMTLTRERKTSDRVRRLIRLAEQRGVSHFVVGLPRLPDGTEGDSAAAARRFGERLEARSGLPVSYVDERLTSVEAERAMREVGADRARRKSMVDQMAAVLILQSWLAQRARLDGEAGE